MSVIALARQVGSGGQAVASGLAKQLGYRIVGRAELRAEAETRGLTLPPSFERFASESGNEDQFLHYLSYGELEFDLALRGSSHADGDQSLSPFLSDISVNRREILLTLQSLIYDLAAGDRIIFVGAGAQIILAEFPWALRVKVIAPAATRIQRMIDAYHLSADEATSAVNQGDRDQVEYNRIVYGEEWHNPELWDLLLNSDRLSVDQVVTVIANVIPGNAVMGLDDQITLKAAAKINRELLAIPGNWSRLVGAFASPDGVSIRGDVMSRDGHDKMLTLATSATGEAKLSDELRDIGPA
jgi:cytidylate kinase